MVPGFGAWLLEHEYLDCVAEVNNGQPFTTDSAGADLAVGNRVTTIHSNLLALVEGVGSEQG